MNETTASMKWWIGPAAWVLALIDLMTLGLLGRIVGTIIERRCRRAESSPS